MLKSQICLYAPLAFAIPHYDRVQQCEFVEASPFYKFNIPRGEKSVKFRKCSQCSKFTLCPGIQVEYLRAFPNSSEEFTPMNNHSQPA